MHRVNVVLILNRMCFCIYVYNLFTGPYVCTVDEQNSQQ